MKVIKLISSCAISLMLLSAAANLVLSQDMQNQAMHDALKDIVEKREAAEFTDKAVSYANEGNLELALYYYDKAIDVYPNDARVYIMRGNVKRDLKDFDGAIADYTLATSTNPHSQLNEGSLLYRFALQKDAEAYYYRGQVYLVTNDYLSAYQDFSKSIEINPNSSAFMARGKIKAMLDFHEEAIEDYTEAINMNDDIKMIYVMRGLAYLDINKITEACKDFLEAVNDLDYGIEARELINIYCMDY
jgi:tetratricopeptide (TPR) repeat protein